MRTIKIATPQSTIFSRAVKEESDRILGLSDALELRDHFSAPVESALPRLYHCELSIVEPWDDAEFDKASAVISSHQPSVVSFHVPSPYVKPVIVARRFVPTGAAMSKSTMLGNAAANMERLRTSAGERTYLIENNNYFPSGGHEIVGEPRFLNQVMESADVGLLLDIGHAEITAWYHRTTLDAYIHLFPLEKARQIHLSGIYRGTTDYEDAHEALTAVDWENTTRIIPECPNVGFVTIEYYHNPGILLDMLVRLRSLLNPGH
jgi:uncharacterized protein (UPF0276 family)